MSAPNHNRAHADKSVRPKQKAFLLAVKRKHHRMRVYAVIAFSVDEALGLLQEKAKKGSTVTWAGGLSSRVAQSLKLKPGDLRVI